MIPIAVLVVGVVVALSLVGARAASVRRRRARHVAPARRPLPEGADAALWSVVEVGGDPRHHLAGKDPTSELRISAEVRRLAEDELHARAFGETPAPRPAELAQRQRVREARVAAEAKRAARIEAGGAPLPRRPMPASGPAVRVIPSRAAS